MVFGAGLFVANLSTTFRLRKFGMHDGVRFPIDLYLGDTPSNPTETDPPPKPLLPRDKRLPVKRVVHLPPDLPEGFPMELRYADIVPSGMPDNVLARLDVSGLKVGMGRVNGSVEGVKVDAHFRADVGGLVSLDKVEALVEHSVMVATKVRVCGGWFCFVYGVCGVCVCVFVVWLWLLF